MQQMVMKARVERRAAACHDGVFCHRIAWVFALQLALTVALCVALARGWLPLPLVLGVLVLATVVAWRVAHRAWLPVRTLAGLMRGWHDGQSDPSILCPERLSRRTDADLAALTEALHGFAARIADYGTRERNFTRDASHELRTPLTVIRTSVNMLGSEDGISDSAKRSVRRIHRAARELEAMVDVLLILARESDPGCAGERFVVNDVLRRELDTASELFTDAAIHLRLDEPARFALQGSVRAFAVLCRQLIRDACRQAVSGHVVVTVLPSALTVSHDPQAVAPPVAANAPASFELAIAQRISARYAWPLELPAAGSAAVTRVQFPDSLPAAA